MPCLLDLLLKKDLTLLQEDDKIPSDELFSSLCFWNASTICSGTDSSLNSRLMLSKSSTLSSPQHNSHSALTLGSCLKMARQIARYCLSSPFAIRRAKRLYSSLWLFFHRRMSALNWSYVNRDSVIVLSASS